MTKRLIQVVICLLSLLVMIETISWPVMFPGTQLGWWQNYHLVIVGEYVGFPVWVLVFQSPFWKPQLGLAWILMIAWATFLYWVAGVVIGLVQKHRK